SLHSCVCLIFSCPFLFFFSLFFLYSYAPPRDLHSFPTRRSSDLAQALFPTPTMYCESLEPSSPCSTTMVAASAAFSCQCEWQSRDRKSTRLNSSHSQISYAVFCLKKKKKKNTKKKKKHTNILQLH